MSQKFRITFYALVLTGPVALLLWGVQRRIFYINSTFGEGISCSKNCFTYSVMLHDLAFLSLAAAILIISLFVRKVFISLVFRFIFVFLLLVFMADVIVLEEFFVRLSLDHIRIYGTQAYLVWEQLKNVDALAHQTWLLIPLLLWLVAFMMLPPFFKSSLKTAIMFLLPPTVGLIIGTILSPPSYVHDWAIRNVISANFGNGVTKPYTEDFKTATINATALTGAQCRKGRDSEPNIVLLILESWSPYQSKLFSGIKDWTPRLDQIAQKNAWYTKFHSGGFSTNEGLISLFTGADFIAPPKNWFEVRPFETAWNIEDTVPRVLNNENYFTAFLTSGDLSFSRKDQWLKNVGFEYIEGHDHSDYDGIKNRLHFNSVPDRALYDRSLKFISEIEAEKRPFFLSIETVSTHHPYIHPETRERLQESVFRYMDVTVSEFYSHLNESGFFENGILIITSDHRAMIPISSLEQNAYGQASASLIPLITVGSGAPTGQIQTRFHQSDLLPSLQSLVSSYSCQQGPYRDIFRPKSSDPRCIYHARGDNRDHIDAFCPEANYTVILDGDDTRLRDASSIDREREIQVIREVNSTRIKGEQRDSPF